MFEIPLSLKNTVQGRYPNARFALLGGSFVRGESTTTSDFDVVIIDDTSLESHRETALIDGVVHEFFIHSREGCLRWFEKDLERRKPSLQSMICEGLLIIGDQQSCEKLQAVAQKQLDQGPRPLTTSEVEDLRYQITDFMDDLIGSEQPEEWMFIAPIVVEKAINLELVMKGKWISGGKRLPQAYGTLDPEGYYYLVNALMRLYSGESKEDFLRWINSLLGPYGGPLRDGYFR